MNINAYVKLGQNPFIHSQDIERKQNSDVIQGQLLCYELTKMDAKQSQASCC